MILRRLFLLFNLLPAILGAQSLMTVEFKVFPQPYTVMSGGRVLQPYSWAGMNRWYKLPLGVQKLTITAPGYMPLNISPEVKLGLKVEEKLEPRNALLTRAATVTTGKGPKSLLFSLDSQKLLVPLVDDTGIDVISLSTFEKETRLTPEATGNLKGFIEGAVLKKDSEIWFSQLATGQIHIYTAPSLEYKSSISLGARGNEVIVFSPDESKALVSNGETKTLSLVDTTSKTLVKTIGLSGIPRGIAFSSDGAWAFVTLFEGSLVEKIAMATFTSAGVLSYGSTGAMRHGVSFGDRLYFSDMLRGAVISAQAPTGRFEKFLYLGPNLTTIALAPKGTYLYGASRGPNNPGDYTLAGPEFGRIFMVDTQDMSVVTTIWGKNQPTGLAVSPDGKWLAFSNYLDNQVEIYRIR